MKKSFYIQWDNLTLHISQIITHVSGIEITTPRSIGYFTDNSIIIDKFEAKWQKVT